MKQEIFDELMELKSSLPKSKDNYIYKAPEGYFDKMKDSVIGRISEEEKKSKLVRFRRIWSVGIAAAVIFIIGIAVSLNHRTVISEDLSAEYSQSFEYLIDNIDDLDESSIILAIEDIEEDGDSEEDSIDDISDYLEENIDDISEEDLQQIF